MDKNFEIPGLIAKENRSIGFERELIKHKLDMMREEQKTKANVRYVKRTMPAQEVKVVDAGQWVANTGTFEYFDQPNSLNNWGYQVGIDPYKSKPYGGGIPTSPLGQKIPPKSLEDYMNMYGGLPKQERQKTALEELVDGMFDTSEKEQFLMDLGYEFFQDQKGFDSFRRGETVWNKALDLEKVFMKEIKIKFKNLLLTKQTLKFKF